MTLSFTVLGRPRPQGSKRPVTAKNGRVVLIESSKGLPDYRNAVAKEAQDAFRELGLEDRVLLHTRPLILDVTFYLRRPKGHYRANGMLKATAPARPITAPDASKLLRSVEDALMAGGAIRDDAQVTDALPRKRYAGLHEPERTVVVVVALAGCVGDGELEAVAA